MHSTTTPKVWILNSCTRNSLFQRWVTGISFKSPKPNTSWPRPPYQHQTAIRCFTIPWSPSRSPRSRHPPFLGVNCVVPCSRPPLPPVYPSSLNPVTNSLSPSTQRLTSAPRGNFKKDGLSLAAGNKGHAKVQSRSSLAPKSHKHIVQSASIASEHNQHYKNKVYISISKFAYNKNLFYIYNYICGRSKYNFHGEN